MARSLNKFHTFQALIAKQVKYYVKPLRWLLLLRRLTAIWIRGLLCDSWRPLPGGGGGCAMATAWATWRFPSAGSWTSWLAITTISLQKIDRMTLFILSHLLLYVRGETAKIMVYTMHGNINENSFDFESDNVFSCSELLWGEKGIDRSNWLETRRLDCMKLTRLGN